jgi:aryl-alcohol dehydrogenase-like predicted oxidoreductase
MEALHKALDLGINYLDTAERYGNGLSEQWIGKGLKGRRGGVFLSTKVIDRDGTRTERLVEQSLEALQTDHVDLIHIHGLKDKEDMARIEAKGGVLEQLMRLREQKMTRFVGITSHFDPAVLATALERHDFDCTQMTLNGARIGMTHGPKGDLEPINADFESVALPVAVRKGMGVIAMKVFGADCLSGQAAPRDLLYYSLSLPVASASVGMPTLRVINENVRLVRAFEPLAPVEMQRISTQLSKWSRDFIGLP